MKLPYDMRASTLEERKQFYKDFEKEKIKHWLNRDAVLAIIIGRHSDIYLNKYKEDRKIPLIIDNYESLEEVKSKILEFLPEGVYYDRNYYKDISKCHSHNLREFWSWKNFDGQELAFDLDPENVNCPIHGTLQERLNKGRGLSFCKKAFEIIKENTINLYEYLTKDYNNVKIAFSGRGFHIHVFDKKAINLSQDERKKIAGKYNRYGIDKWVTTGEMRLIRLPFTLNGLSSRVVTPIEKSEVMGFNPKEEALPNFLG